MSALDELLSNIHWMAHDLVDSDQIDCEEEKRLESLHDQSKAELAAMRERVAELEAAVLASGKLLADAKACLESEIKAGGGIGMEHEIGLVDSIDAWRDLHGDTTAALARLDREKGLESRHE